MFTRPPPNANKYYAAKHNQIPILCGYTQPLRGLSDLTPVVENNFQGPMFTRLPPNTNKYYAATHNHFLG